LVGFAALPHLCNFINVLFLLPRRQRYIGKIRFAAFDAVSGTKKILIATEQNVIAALHPKNGLIYIINILFK